MAGRVGRRGLGALCSRLESLSLAPARGASRSQPRSQSQPQSQSESQSQSLAPSQTGLHAQPQSHPQTQTHAQEQAEPMPQSRDPCSNQWHATRPTPFLHSAFKPLDSALPALLDVGSIPHSHALSSFQPSTATSQIWLPHAVEMRSQHHGTTSAKAPCQLINALENQYQVNTPGLGLHGFSTTAGSFQAAGPLLALNTLAPAKGSTHNVKRLGRGIGSGKGKTAGRGHKGQKSRSGNKPRIGFEGGQTPLRLRLPKRGFHNPFSLDFQVVNLKDVIEKIDGGAIDPSSLITMKTLKDAGLGGKATRDGVKLLGGGCETVSVPLHFEVSRVSESAREAVEKAGGSVTRVHYNKLGLRALLQPEWFAKKGRLLPRPARPPPRIRQLGLVDVIGRLPAPSTRMAAEAS